VLARHTEPSRTDCLTFGSNARLVPGASLNNRSILCCSPQAPSLDKIGWLRIVQEAIARQSRSPAAKSRAHPLVLLVIRRGFGCGAISFAQRNLLILLSLFFPGPCARCPLSFSPISTVIWLERHCIPLMRQVDFGPANHIYASVRVLPVLAICPPRALPKTTSKSDARLRCAMSCRSQTPIGVFKGGRIWLKVKSSFSIH